MQVDPRMYDRPMTEEEKRLMMIQGLRQNNMMMADSNSAVRASDFNSLDPYSAVRTNENSITIPSGAADPLSVVRELEMLNADRTRGVPMPDDMNPTLRNEQPYTPPVERISPMGSPMTPQEIDEEIMRLQMLKQTMGT
tara:strand:- start:3 stop:419 length:417 start_codon:yes stop_codon:yes gene_type:complete